MDFGRDDYNRSFTDIEGLIPENEPVFLLRSSDENSPSRVMDWASSVLQKGGDLDVVMSAVKQAHKMVQWQMKYGFKSPDLEKFSESVKLSIPKECQLIIEKWKLTNSITQEESSKVFLEFMDEPHQSNELILLTALDVSYHPPGCDELRIEDFKLSEKSIEKASLIIYVHQNYCKVLKSIY